MRALGWAVLSFLCVVSGAPLAAAQSYQNSPHVEGNSASVKVYYDQRVNTTNVKKDVFVYNGPKTDEVLAAVRRIVSDQRAQLSTLVDKDDVSALRADLLNQLQAHFDSQPDVSASLRALLDERAPEHLGYLDVGIGLSTVVAGASARGGSVRLGGFLDMLTSGALRHALGMRIGVEVLARDAPVRRPDGIDVGDPNDRLSFHGWFEPGYDVLWLGKRVSLQLALMLGAQTFETGTGSKPFITYGIALAPEVRIGPEDGTGVRIGLQYRVASMIRPAFDFDILAQRPTPERNIQQLLFLYAGMYFGLFG